MAARAIGIFAILLITCPAVASCLTHAQAPAASEQSPLVYPELSFRRLLNDLQIVVASAPHLGESMTIGLVLRYGSVFDPADKGGLAHLVSLMFLKATQDRTSKAIQDELSSLGATIEGRCDWDGIRFILRGQSSRFERSLLLLYQIVGEAVFDEADFSKVKEEILQTLDRPQDPRQLARNRFEAALFRGTSYGRPLQGSKLSLQNISVGDVRYFYRRYVSPNTSSLLIAGSDPCASHVDVDRGRRGPEVAGSFLCSGPGGGRTGAVRNQEDPGHGRRVQGLGGFTRRTCGCPDVLDRRVQKISKFFRRDLRCS